MITRLHRFLRSTRLALATMGGLALVVGLSTVVPQRLATEPSDYAAFKARSPLLMGVAEGLGLTDVFNSPLYLGLAALFTVNLALCTWGQVSAALRRLRSRRMSARGSGAAVGGREGDRRVHLIPSPGDHLRTGGRVVRFFEDAGYAMRSLGPGRWEGRRRWWGYSGLPAFHLALLLVVVGALSVSAGSFRGTLELAEGQGFVAGSDAFLGSSRGFLGRAPREGFAVRLDSFRSAYHPNGQIIVRESDVSVRVDGRESRHVLASSHPVSAGGYRIYQTTRFGWSVLLRLTSPEGSAQEGFVNLAAQGGDEDDPQTLVYRQTVTPPGSSTSLDLEYRARLNTEVGSPGASEATVRVAVTDGGAEVYSGPLAMGESLELPGGVELTYVDLRQWSGLVLVATPGLWLVYLGGALSLVALLLHFTVVPERIRIHAVQGRPGAAGYRLVGWRRRYGATYTERQLGLAKSLESALREAGDDVTSGERIS